MSVTLNSVAQQASSTKNVVPTAPPTAPATSKAKLAKTTASKDGVSLSSEVKKDERGIPLPKTQSVRVQPWGVGKNDNACLWGILRQAGYSKEDIDAKGPDGKSLLLTRIAKENGLKDPNLVHPGKSISFVPKEELDIYEARKMTARRDASLKALAQGPVNTPQGVVTPKEGFKALADASLERLNKAYRNLPESGRKGVEEQLTVVASDWSKGPGNRARFERAGTEDRQTLQRTWLAQAASQYARSEGAEGKKSDLINLGQGARQFLEAQIGLHQPAPASQNVCKVESPSQQPASAPAPKAPLPAYINHWGQGLRDVGQSVSDLGRWAQSGVNRGVDSVTASIDGNLLKEKRWAAQNSPTGTADIWALSTVGSAAHAVGDLVKGAARLSTGQLEVSGAVIGGVGTAQQWTVNDRVYEQVNGDVSRFVQKLSL